MRTIVPKEEVRLPTGLVCPRCERVRRFTPLTGIQTSMFGRFVVVACNTCGYKGRVQG